MLKCFRVVGWVGMLCCLAGAGWCAGAVVVNDAESDAGWRGVTLIDDAKEGKHTVRHTMPAQPHLGGCTLDLKGSAIEFTRNQSLRFWYRFTGKGASSLMIKIVDPKFSEGWQATYAIAPERPADGQWHHAEVDLSTEFMKWGNSPDLQSRYLNFRTDGGGITLDLDQVTLMPRQFAARVVKSRVQEGAAEMEIALENSTAGPLALEARGDGLTERVTLAAGAKSTAVWRLALDPNWLREAKPLELGRRAFTVQVAGDNESAKEMEVTFTRPLDLPAHPRLLVSGAEIARLKEKVGRLDWAGAIYAGQLKAADGWLEKAVILPDRGSQWWHWYACKKDGGRLKTVSPTEHECPVCKTVYTGWPYDDVVLDRIHGGYANAVRTLGFVYQMTGERKYAEKARDILLAYAERYTQYPLHNINGKEAIGGGRVGPQTLDESTWLIPMAQGADMIWDALTDAERKRAEDGLFRPAAQVIRQQWIGVHNIQCWKNSAVGLTGLLLGDAELVADAVASEHGFRQQIARGVNEDGQWYEGAWGYHFYTVSAILPLAEAGARCGLGLYEFEQDGRSYRRLFEGPLQLAMPHLVLPAFNDSGTVGLKGSRVYEVALARYRDPRLAGVLQGVKRDTLETLINGVDALPAPGEQPRGSRNFGAAGYAILEHGAGADAAGACLKYGPHGGGHGHPDKLNLLIARRGTLIGVDPGTAAYGVPVQKEWYRATLAHNTVTVDEANQAEATGACLAFGSVPGISGVLAAAGPIYEGVEYRRAVALFGEDLVLILDLAHAEKERTFDFAWHNAGRWSTPPAGEAVAPPRKPGYMHLSGMVRAGALPPIAVNDKVSVGVAVASETGETWAGRGFASRDEDRPACIIRRVRGTDAVVGWALGLDGQVAAVTARAAAGGGVVEATVAGKTYRLTVRPGAAPLLAEADGQRLSIEALKH